ncbi:PIG-L family deacetylase [Cellulomonas sp. NPDC058312]|uniref:PIG-L family deacetylase n=1 Tax=Cellulomonas sp. NPDC058312 TaxID=3346441 RepID=UPI0036EAADDD
MSTTASTSPVTGGVLAVHAHPDDETLATGALLATWAAAGLPALVVTCTRGERGEVIGAALAHLEGDGAGLAAHREREVAAATAALGVEQVFLDTLPPGTRGAAAVGPAASAPRYEDSGMAWLGTGRAGSAGSAPPRAFVSVPLDEAAGRLAALLRERRPDLVVTYEPGGGYGHPDHVRAHEVTTRAVQLAGDVPGWSPAVAWAVAPAADLRAGYAALAQDPDVRDLLAAHADDRRGTRESPLALPDPAGPLPSVAVDGAADLLVDVAPVRDRVLAALRAHATQVQAVHPLDQPAACACLALSNLVLAPVLPVESYRWAPGGGPSDAVVLPPGARRATHGGSAGRDDASAGDVA